jgi:hypothetical protein
MVQRSVSIVQNANAIPKFRLLHAISLCTDRSYIDRERMPYLGVCQVNEGILISSVGLLQIIHHEITVSYHDGSVNGND